jgi:nitrate reductase gamma subunit
MKIWFPFFSVIALVLVAFMGVKAANLQFLFGVVIPYAAFAVFILGFIYKVVNWGRSPVPFRIPTTAGQQKSFPWIKHNRLESPFTTLDVIGRMALEVLLFRSLFRNLRGDLREGKIGYASAKWLWLAGLVFHWSFLTIFVRHLRFFFQKVPLLVQGIEGLDSFLQIGAPLLYITDLTLIIAVTFLFLRRVADGKMHYISLASDHFPLFLILGIAISGVLMRYFLKTHIVAAKTLAMGLISLNPVVPEGLGAIFYVHIFLVSALLAYFPFSKLMHMGGVFMSPTRNLTNNSRYKQHVNPWNYPVKTHKYSEYEDDFRDKMKSVGIPVEKE